MKRIREDEWKQTRENIIDRLYDNNVQLLKRREVDWDERDRRHMLEVRAKEDQRELEKKQRKDRMENEMKAWNKVNINIKN